MTASKEAIKAAAHQIREWIWAGSGVALGREEALKVGEIVASAVLTAALQADTPADIAAIREALSDDTIASYPDFVAAVSAALDELERTRSAFSPPAAPVVAVPDGWVLVPKELTPEMQRVLFTLNSATARSTSDVCQAYQSLLNVAPSTTTETGDGGEPVARLRGLIRWAHDTLYEINPSNYDHDEVCKLNEASVEVILGLAVELGERHGKTDEWWSNRLAATPQPASTKTLVGALTAAAEELDRIFCVPPATETKNLRDQFDLAIAYADRGARAARAALSNQGGEHV